MKSILNFWETPHSVDINFTFRGKDLIKCTTNGDESPELLSKVFNTLVSMDYIPNYGDKEVVCNLVDGGDDVLDIYFYIDGDFDGNDTPVISGDDFVKFIKEISK